MRIRTLVTPICSSFSSSSPTAAMATCWNHSKPYTPEKTILCLNGVSWPLTLPAYRTHPPQSYKRQLFTRGSAQCCSSIWAHCIPRHFPLVCFWTHTTASVLLAWLWREVTDVAVCSPSLGPTEHPAFCFLVSACHCSWLTRLVLLELNWISNNAINISIFILASPTLSPLLTDSPFLGLVAWQF